jgi:hypothetical protein
MGMEHAERRRWAEEVARINRRLSDDAAGGAAGRSW